MAWFCERDLIMSSLLVAAGMGTVVKAWSDVALVADWELIYEDWTSRLEAARDD